MTAEDLKPFDAERIIESLRGGLVPYGHLRILSVGRDVWLDSIRHDLKFVAGGASKLRFISAPWGGGKTHFLALVKEYATELNFAVSYVELHSRDAPLDRFEIVFSKIMHGLVFPGDQNLESVLDSWASKFPYYTTTEIEAELQRLSPSLDFRAALRACLSHCRGDLAAHRAILRSVAGWLQGDSLGSDLRKFGVHNAIKITNVTEVLGAFLRFLVSHGYSGLLVMLDEAEAVTSLAQSKRRNEANQNIRKLLDNADEHVGLYVVFATTPAFLTDGQRGAKSYPALWSRIRSVVDFELAKTSKRSLIITLDPLEAQHLWQLADKVAMVHSRAYDWPVHDYIDATDFSGFIAKFAKASKGRTARSFLRAWVYVLDHVEQRREPGLCKSLYERVRFDEEDAPSG